MDLRALPLLISVLLAPTAFGQEDSADELTRIRAALEHELAALHEEHGFPGATVAVALVDGRSTTVAVGVERAGSDEPLTADARMLAGSTGKTYVAACVMLLVQEGLLDLDEPISKRVGETAWFGGLANAEDLTLRLLMRHTSGLPDHVWDARFQEALQQEPGRTWEIPELVAYLDGAPALFPAGEGWSYADTNFVIAGLVLEQVTGRSYYDLLRERVLEPLELTNTLPQDRHDLPGLVRGHTSVPNAFGLSEDLLPRGRHAINPQMEYCGGGVMTTSEDLARFGAALFGGDLLEPASLVEMLDGVPASRRVGEGFTYGLGVMIGEDESGTHCGHTGWFPGYQSKLAWYPDHGMALAVMLNTDDRTQTSGFPHGWGTRLAAAAIAAR